MFWFCVFCCYFFFNFVVSAKLTGPEIFRFLWDNENDTQTTRKTFGTQFYDMVEFHFQCEDDNISSKKNFSSNFCFSLCLLLLILCFYSHRTHRPFMLTLSPYSVHATNLREADWIALRQKTHILLLEKSKNLEFRKSNKRKSLHSWLEKTNHPAAAAATSATKWMILWVYDRLKWLE